MYKISAAILGLLVLTGCAGMGTPNLTMDTSTARPPPLPIADMSGGMESTRVPAKTAPVKRQASPPPLPQARPIIESPPVPAPVPVAPSPPAPHHWWEHLKFWQK